jgi:hypothetical protein
VTTTVVLAASCIAIACAAAARLIVPPTVRLAPRVRPYAVASRSRLGHAALPLDTEPVVGRLFGPPTAALARRIGRVIESRSDGHLELRLAQAGLVDVGVDEHRVRQVAQGAAAAIVGGAVGAILLRAPVATLAIAAAAGFWGVTRARAAVDRAIEQRAERIRLELPTIAQLLALHVRAGAGPMQAVQRVVARGSGVVVGELDTALRHARTGGREADAFRAIAVTTPEPSAARTYELSRPRSSGARISPRDCSRSPHNDARHTARRCASRPCAGAPRCCCRRSGSSPRSCCCSSPRRCPRSSWVITRKGRQGCCSTCTCSSHTECTDPNAASRPRSCSATRHSASRRS